MNALVIYNLHTYYVTNYSCNATKIINLYIEVRYFYLTYGPLIQCPPQQEKLSLASQFPPLRSTHSK